MRLGRSGFDSVARYLAGGMEALLDRPALVKQIDSMMAVARSEQLPDANHRWSWMSVV